MNNDALIPDDIMQATAKAHAEFASSKCHDNLSTIIARALMTERAKWEAELATLRAENERLREALKPFAAVNQKHVRTGIWHHHDEIAEQILSADDFSRARAALKGGE